MKSSRDVVKVLANRKIEYQTDEFVELDITEIVSGPTSWVSPVVVVPKPSGDIRLCVDMRQANMAVKRERFPIPTTDIEQVL